MFPEHVEALREEAEMSSVTADGLPLLDSFLKESMRYNSIDASKIMLTIKFKQVSHVASYMSA